MALVNGKEKLLTTSNFSSSHSVFKRLVLQTLKNQGLIRERVGTLWKNRKMLINNAFVEKVNPFPHNDTDAPGHKPFENTVEKGEIGRNEQFLLYPQCFLPI